MSDRKDHIEVLKAYPLVIKDQKAIQDAIDFAINSLEVEETFSNWIPVSERLPEEDGYYSVIQKSGVVGIYVFHKQGNSEEYWKRCALAWAHLSTPSITLDELKEIREEMTNLRYVWLNLNGDTAHGIELAMNTIDKKISELEGNDADRR